MASRLLLHGCRKEVTRMRKERGFTLIELLIVVAIIGILAAIAIPNMLNSIDRSKQKRTMADMRAIATALEQNFYPIQSSQGAISTTVSPALAPLYTRTVPIVDGWSWDMQYGTTDTG